MKTFEPFFLSLLESLQFGWQIVRYVLIFVSAFFRQRASLACELVAIRSQLTFYKESIRQKKQSRPRFNPAFRLLWVLLSRLWSGWKSAADLMKPKTVLQWHAAAFLQWWRWKSRRKGGRPAISQEMRALIRRLSRENVLWSAETIHGHLVLLGLDPPCPDTIRKYLLKPKGGGEISQSWLTFLRNHMQVSWAMDFFTVPTIRFKVLYVFVVLNHSRRQVVQFGVTAHPTMAWVIQQLREAMPFDVQPRYMFRDNDGIYGDEVSPFLVGTGIEEVKTAYRSPWQNPFVERYGGTLWRELLDHVIILSEEHLKGLLKEFIEEYYHIARPHQGLDGDTPFPSAKPEAVTGRESPGFDSGCRRSASPLRSSGSLIRSLPDNHRKQQNGPGLVKAGSPARQLELQNSSLTRARCPALVLNSYPESTVREVFRVDTAAFDCSRSVSASTRFGCLLFFRGLDIGDGLLDRRRKECAQSRPYGVYRY